MFEGKHVWINDLLSVKGFVSSREQIRFIKYENFYFFMVTINTCNLDEIEKIKTSKVYSLLKSKVHSSNICAIGYEDNKYIILNEGGELEEYDNDTLINFFSKLYPRLAEDCGTLKEENTEIVCTLHKWCRKNLSKYAVVNDIDALHYYGDSIVFLELKNPKQSINTWKPYIEDVANYSALEFFKKFLGINYYVISFNPIPDDLIDYDNDDFQTRNEKMLKRNEIMKYVGLFSIEELNKNEIKHRKLIIDSASLISFPFGITDYTKRN